MHSTSSVLIYELGPTEELQAADDLRHRGRAHRETVNNYVSIAWGQADVFVT